MVKSRRTKLNVRNRSAKKRTLSRKSVQRAGSIRRTKLNVRNRSAKRRTLKGKRVQRVGSIRRTKLNVRNRSAKKRTLKRKRVQRAGADMPNSLGDIILQHEKHFPFMSEDDVDYKMSFFLKQRASIYIGTEIQFTLYKNSKGTPLIAFISLGDSMESASDRVVKHSEIDKSFTFKGKYLRIYRGPQARMANEGYIGKLNLEPKVTITTEPQTDLNFNYTPLEKFSELDSKAAKEKLAGQGKGTYILRIGSFGPTISYVDSEEKVVHFTTEDFKKNYPEHSIDIFMGISKKLNMGGEEITFSMLEPVYDITLPANFQPESVQQEDLFPLKRRIEAEEILKPYEDLEVRKGTYILRTNSSGKRRISYIDSNGKIKHEKITGETFKRFNVKELDGKYFEGVTFKKYKEDHLYDQPISGESKYDVVPPAQQGANEQGSIVYGTVGDGSYSSFPDDRTGRLTTTTAQGLLPGQYHKLSETRANQSPRNNSPADQGNTSHYKTKDQVLGKKELNRERRGGENATKFTAGQPGLRLRLRNQDPMYANQKAQLKTLQLIGEP